jgi:hypothetical protein
MTNNQRVLLKLSVKKLKEARDILAPIPVGEPDPPPYPAAPAQALRVNAA